MRIWLVCWCQQRASPSRSAAHSGARALCLRGAWQLGSLQAPELRRVHLFSPGAAQALFHMVVKQGAMRGKGCAGTSPCHSRYVLGYVLGKEMKGVAVCSYVRTGVCTPTRTCTHSLHSLQERVRVGARTHMQLCSSAKVRPRQRHGASACSCRSRWLPRQPPCARRTRPRMRPQLARLPWTASAPGWRRRPPRRPRCGRTWPPSRSSTCVGGLAGRIRTSSCGRKGGGREGDGALCRVCMRAGAA